MSIDVERRLMHARDVAKIDAYASSRETSYVPNVPWCEHESWNSIFDACYGVNECVDVAQSTALAFFFCLSSLVSSVGSDLR